ncbi:hypothetical protein BX661DRAFT_103671 [Kickxella alabastrina]|uniref:uncharacterized protein n=1 Tax=Kickxella alabastrina TaxID=61397 RepID=UPI00221FCB1A|nr:uncharacterized protein BX661DRAFT_103671 [Kickxella alabastrina]KAI7818901.1 hypothetical protein BX661DRAFT_103671 [Kickxella alabastrina]
MSSIESIQALNILMKRAPSKRVRKERNRQNVTAFIRRKTPTTEPSTTTAIETLSPKELTVTKKLSEKELQLERNTKTLRAVSKLVTKKNKDLQKDVLELLAAQREQRRAKLHKKKHSLSYFDFEDQE